MTDDRRLPTPGAADPDANTRLSPLHLGLIAVLLCLTPLIGVLYRGDPPGRYLEFPPTTRYVVHAPFNWPVFLLLIAFVVVVCFPFVHRFIAYDGKAGRRVGATGGSFPWWGWLGTGMVAVFWFLAWNRFAFFTPLQRYTFFPLWLGCILVLNGLSCRRRGSCLLRSRPRFFFFLFPASALFWWYFEYLNRFVQNWYYIAGGEVSAAEYVVHASLCFSTVLPAVVSAEELLGTFPRLTAPFRRWRPIPVPAGKGTGLPLVGAAVLSLALLAVLPDVFFPLVWIAPLLVLVGFQLTAGRLTVFDGLREGDWRRIVVPALAALLCGFLWEMWNWKSLAHWQYSIPFVHRFRIFAMPLPGYAGYLPFGLECVAAAALIRERLPEGERESEEPAAGTGS